MIRGEAIDVVLRDGSTARVRVAGDEDAPAVAGFLGRLTPEARWFRFFSAGLNLERAARAAVTPPEGRALLVLSGAPERVVGHAMYARTRPEVAEVAFAIDGDWQGLGLATLLLAHLADAASADGIAEFIAVTLPENHRMIGVFRDSGFPVEVHADPGELEVRLPTSLTPEGRRRFEQRERDAAVAAVGHVLRPDGVLAVAGSARADTTGGALLRNLTRAGFTGALHAVVEDAGTVEGIAVAPSIAAVPGRVELAVLAVAPEQVVPSARACGERGDVRALVVLLEGGEDDDRAELLDTCRRAGMRLVGPRCLGVRNTDTAIRLDATFAPQPNGVHGRVGFASQSGGFGIAALDLAAERGVALSAFVSMGAKADLSGNDLLQYWEADDGTDVVLLYLESFGNPRRFGSIARRMTVTKPVIVVKSGRRPAEPPDGGASQTAALLGASDTHVDAMFHDAGVIRTDTLGEMFDLATLLTRQPLPRGSQVAVLTNAGGLGVQCADACAAAGLATGEPLDIGAAAGADAYGHALDPLLADGGADAVIVLFTRSLVAHAADVAAAVDARAAAAADHRRPLLAVFMGADRPPEGPVPRFRTAEEAVAALRRAVAHAGRRSAPPDAPVEPPGVDADRAASIVASGLAAGPGWLPPRQVEALLGCYGLTTAPARIATSARGAARAARRLGGPVAVKVTGHDVHGKAEMGAVRLGVSGPLAVERAAEAVLAAAAGRGCDVDGVLVQRMAEGVELLLGVVGDPQLGPLVALAAGGATARLVDDVQVRLAPVGPREATAMVTGLRTFPLLDGFGGRPRADLAAVEDAVLRVGALAAAHPEIAELDCDPLVAGPDAAIVVDARVRLEPTPAPRPYAALGG